MNERGFSLLEALIALAILGGAVTTALSVSVSSTSRTKQALADFRAFMAADAILQRIGPEIAIVPQQLSGHFADGSAWQLAISPSSPTDQSGTLYDVKSKVTPPGRPDIALRTIMRAGAQ